MRTISYRINDLKKVVIEIGYMAENEHTRVIIDCAEVFAEYPGAVPSMKVQPPRGTAYPREVTTDGNSVIWDVKDSDLTERGRGEIQLTFTKDGKICKSAIAKTNISRSIVGSGTVPSPVQDWIDEASEVLGNLEDAEVNQPVIGEDGYWYTWDQENGEYVKTDTKAQGEDGDPGQPGTDATPDLITVPYEDLTFPVAAGTQCYHDGKLYQANQAIQSSEQWTAAHWTETTVEAQITDVKNALRAIAVTPEMFGAKGDGVTDDSQAMQDAINAGYEVRLGDNKTYYLASTVLSRNDCHLIGGRNSVIKTQSVTTEGNETTLNTAFQFLRTVKKTTTLTTNYSMTGSSDNSANKFTLSDMNDIEVGDIMVIRATDQHYSYARPYFYLGAVLLISNIDDGHIYTSCDMPFNITNTENVTVKIYKAPEVIVENITFVSDRAHIRYSYAIAIEGCKNSIIRNCKMDEWWNAVLLHECFNTLVDNVTISNAKYDNSLFGDSYGVQLYECTNTIIQRINSINAQGNIELTGQTINLNTFIRNCNVSGECRAIGIDMHENAYNTVIEDCTLGGLSLFGTCNVSRCRIIRNNRISNTDFGIVIRGSHNPDWARYRIVDCELIGNSQFISINKTVPEEEIQSFENIFGNIEIENIRGGFLMIAPTITSTVTANIIKRLIVKNWQNCYEIYRTSYNVIDYMEVDSCNFVHSYWINNHSDAFSFSGIKLLRRTNNSPWTDNIYVDTKDHGRMYELPKGKSIALSSSDTSAHYVVCGKNLASNDPSDIKIGGNSGNAGEVNTFTVNTAFNNALSVNSDGQLVFTQPNNTSSSHIYPLYMFYAEKRSTVKISCTFKNIGSTNGANFGMYLCVVNAATGLIRWKGRGTDVTATASGVTAVQTIPVDPGEYVMGWIRCNIPVANSVTVFEDYYMMFRESDLSDPFVFEKYNGKNMDGDGTLTSVEGQNWIASSAETFNTTIKASMLS